VWLRTEKHMSVVEIAKQLALPKTTVYYWIRGLPLGRARRQSTCLRKGNRRMCASYQRLHDDAYARGVAEYDELIKVPTFRDFVVLYIAAIQFHADQDLGELRQFWGELLDINGASIRFQRKSNSGQLKGRRWRSAHGVLAIRVFDTYLRSRLQAWIDRVRQDWHLDSAQASGRSSVW
jgi:hypothetical protein